MCLKSEEYLTQTPDGYELCDCKHEAPCDELVKDTERDIIRQALAKKPAGPFSEDSVEQIYGFLFNNQLPKDPLPGFMAYFKRGKG